MAKVYKSYEELLADPNVDIVYTATTNQAHMDNTILALNHGKPVLCEKPMAVDAVRAGGALLDLGIYPLAFACMVFGKTPNRVSGLSMTVCRQC